MPNRIKSHRPPGALPSRQKTLRQKQVENGRTLALDGAAWRRLRAQVLAEQPLCAHCYAAGILRPARDVDHVDNDPSNNDRANLLGLCTPCHSRKTRRETFARNRQQPGATNRPLALADATAFRSA